MKRKTITLPDDLADALDREARRRGVAMSQIVREALDAHLRVTRGRARKLPFAALGRSGHHSTARDFDMLLRAAWGR